MPDCFSTASLMSSAVDCGVDLDIEGLAVLEALDVDDHCVERERLPFNRCRKVAAPHLMSAEFFCHVSRSWRRACDVHTLRGIRGGARVLGG